MYTNDVVVAAAGFSIGVITKELITKVLEEAVLPILNFAVSKLRFVHSAKSALFEKTSNWKTAFRALVHLANVSWLMFNWLATIVLTFLILEYLLNMSIVRMRTHLSEEDERMFKEAKKEAEM